MNSHALTDIRVHLEFHKTICQEDFLSDNQVFKSENKILFLVHSNVASVKRLEVVWNLTIHERKFCFLDQNYNEINWHTYSVKNYNL